MIPIAAGPARGRAAAIPALLLGLGVLAGAPGAVPAQVPTEGQVQVLAQAQSGTVARPLIPRPAPPSESPADSLADPLADDPSGDPATDPDAAFGAPEEPEGFVRPEYERPFEDLPQATVDRAWARLQALNKITARVDDLGIPVGESAAFGTLMVTVRACRTTPPEQTPENAAFLQIDDTPPGEPTERTFSGWMFASSPAVAAMEHPVYDVWVVECTEGPPPEPEDFGRETRYALPGDPPPPAPMRPPR